MDCVNQSTEISTYIWKSGIFEVNRSFVIEAGVDDVRKTSWKFEEATPLR